MNNQRALLVAVAVALVLAALLFWPARSPEVARGLAGREAVAGPDHREHPHPVGTEAALPADQAAMANAPQPRRAPSKQFPISVDDALYDPKTPEEAAWLERNGFPSRAELDSATASQARFSKLDVSDGISPTEIIHAEMMSVTDEVSRRKALGFLNRAAADGAIYALEAIGRIYGPGTLDDPIKSEAYYKAAGMLGDWGVAFRVRSPLSAQDEVLAHLLAHQILDNIDLDRRRRGMQPLRRVSRPGLNERLLAVSNYLPAGHR